MTTNKLSTILTKFTVTFNPFDAYTLYYSKKRCFPMINVCDSGFAKTLGLSALAFCCGMICGMFLPLAVVAVVETLLLITFGYLCLFKW